MRNNDKERFEKIEKEIESKIVEKIQGILDAASESVGLKPERWEKEGDWWEQPCRIYGKANGCQARTQQRDLMCVGKHIVNGQTAKPKSLESCLQGLECRNEAPGDFFETHPSGWAPDCPFDWGVQRPASSSRNPARGGGRFESEFQNP